MDDSFTDLSISVTIDVYDDYEFFNEDLQNA